MTFRTIHTNGPWRIDTPTPPQKCIVSRINRCKSAKLITRNAILLASRSLSTKHVYCSTYPHLSICSHIVFIVLYIYPLRRIHKGFYRSNNNISSIVGTFRGSVEHIYICIYILLQYIWRDTCHISHHGDVHKRLKTEFHCDHFSFF